MDGRKLAITLGCLAALAVTLLFMARVEPSEVPTIEQLLSAEDVAEIERVRSIFGREPGGLLVAVPAARQPQAEAALRGVEGVVEVAGLRGQPGVIVVALEPGAVRLTRARALTAAIERQLEGLDALVVGTPQLRAASWAVVGEDLHRLLPLLVLVVVLVPVAFFGSIGAALFPLVMAALTTTISLALYQWLAGPLTALVMLLVPMVWSIATLDAIHLYYRVRRSGSVTAAKQELYAPCLVTTLTTTGGLLALAVQGESHFVRLFGLWSAAGACIAYVLTFTVGTAILTLSMRPRRLPRWPVRATLAVMLVSRRRARLVVAAWLLALVGAAVAAAGIDAKIRFPHVFAPDHPMARDLAAMEARTGAEMAPLDIYLEPTDERGRTPRALVAAVALVSHQVGTYAETRAVLPRDLEVEGADMVAIDDPRLAAWARFDLGHARIQVHLAPTSVERREEIVKWLRHFDRTMLDHHRISLGGPAYHYMVAERRGLRGTLIGGTLSLLVVVAALAWSFRRPALLAVAVVGNLVPLLLVAGLMGALGVPWSLALIPLPAVLLGLAVDDTVHMLWPLRRGRRILRAATGAGPALLATTAVLSGCVATLAVSGLQLNRELGLLLAAGMVLALACDLSLLPALLKLSSRRRSTRTSP